MLFFRNKLDDFKNLKTSFLKIYLMSLPLFHKSDLQYNSSFRIFWSFLLGHKSLIQRRSNIQYLTQNLRYNILISNFFENKYNPELTTFVYHPFFGSLVSYYSPTQFKNNSIVVLNNQYLNFKAFKKFIFFHDFFNLLNAKKTDINITQENMTKTCPDSRSYRIPRRAKSFLAYGRGVEEEFFPNLLVGITPLTYLFVTQSDFQSGVRALANSLQDFQSFLKILRFYTIKRSNNGLIESIYLPYYYSYNFFSGFLNFLDVKLRFFSFEFFNYFFQNSSLFTDQTTKSMIYINKKDKEMGLLNKFLSNYSVLNSFQNDYYFFNNYEQDTFRTRYFFGSFRSKLHWYYYPVQYFFSFRHLLSENFFVFLFNSLSFGFFVDFKYMTSFIIFDKSSLFSNPLFFTYAFFNNFEFFLSGDRSRFIFKRKIDQSSDFLGFFNHVCSRFFFLSSEDNSFVVRLQNRFLNPNFLTDIFLFRNLDYKFLKYIVTFNSFFFSLEHLSFLYKINNMINFNPQSYFTMHASNYVLDFDNFIANLEFNAKSIDGSGRHNRPKGVSQSLDKIFTYREYEKYRKEHHRQRFRGISPHWIQTSFKNRASFKRYYQSPDFVKSRVTKRLLNNMSKSYGSFRFKNSPRRLRHISNFASNLNEPVLQNFLSRSVLSMNNSLDSKNSYSSVNFVDMVQGFDPLSNDKLASIRQKIMRAYNYNSILRTDGDVEKWHKKQSKKSIKRKNYRFDKFKRYRLFDFPFRFSVDAESLFRKPIAKSANVPFSNLKNYPKDFSYVEEFLKNVDQTKPKMKKYAENNVNLGKLQKLSLRSQIDEYFKDLSRKHQKSSKHLKYMIPQIGGNTKQGGSFINTRKPSKLRNIFQSYSSANPSWNFRAEKRKKFIPTTLIQKMEHDIKKPNLKNLDYFKRRNKLLYSAQRHDSKVPHILDRKRIGGSVGFRYPQHKASLNSITNPKYHRDSPRYLGSTRVGKRKLGFYKDGLPKTNLGGINKSSRSNFFMYDQGRQRRHKLAGKIKKHRKMYYAPNVKRFVRKYNRVLMHIPYIYSKWFTQNPRLSLAVDNSFLNLFANNQYDEFKFIYTQAHQLFKAIIFYFKIC